jgi:m7GpppX diphosphatase
MQIEDLYCLAIVHKHGIRSLRELNGSHLPLLHTLLTEGKEAIRQKFGLPHSKIRWVRVF